MTEVDEEGEESQEQQEQPQESQEPVEQQLNSFGIFLMVRMKKKLKRYTCHKTLLPPGVLVRRF
jgi:hypothetical protein